jgi:hypothetical protein
MFLGKRMKFQKFSTTESPALAGHEKCPDCVGKRNDKSLHSEKKSPFLKEDLGRSYFTTEAVAPAGMGTPDFAFYRTQA